MPSAIVVGSGPNGLAGAVRLAEAGLDVTVLEASEVYGGGTQTSENTLPGLLHDDCSGFHPTVVASPYLRTLDLGRHGLELLWPDVQLGHPLDSGEVALLHRSVSETADGLGADGRRWSSVFGPLTRNFDKVVGEVFRPVLHVPRHPFALARFGLPSLLPAMTAARAWKDEPARALFGGVAAHAFAPLTAPVSASVGFMLTTAAHAVGWPVAKGGSHSIARALVSRLTELGGTVSTGVRVTSWDQVSHADVVLLDLAPPAVERLLGDRLPSRNRRAYRNYRFGPGSFKVDLAVEGGVPWRKPELAAAGTLHLGGTIEQIAAAEADVCRGRMPARPFVLVGQQYVADPSRSVGDVHPIYAYAHVPAGYAGDATEAVIDQIERFAPGVRARIVGRFSRGPAELEAHNANYVGGDIATGINSPVGVVFRPVIAANPYRTGAKGVYLCSAATPPGAGVHGMGGFNAAESALRDLGR